jgi:hypothetical protein
MLYTSSKNGENKMSSKLCKFWVLYGEDSLFYCGLDEKHDGDHLVAFPNKEKD